MLARVRLGDRVRLAAWVERHARGGGGSGGGRGAGESGGGDGRLLVRVELWLLLPPAAAAAAAAADGGEQLAYRCTYGMVRPPDYDGGDVAAGGGDTAGVVATARL
jgi:hypothetical protein